MGEEIGGEVRSKLFTILFYAFNLTKTYEKPFHTPVSPPPFLQLHKGENSSKRNAIFLRIPRKHYAFTSWRGFGRYL